MLTCGHDVKKSLIANFGRRISVTRRNAMYASRWTAKRQHICMSHTVVYSSCCIASLHRNINQSVSQSINQSINQSISQSIYLSIYQKTFSQFWKIEEMIIDPNCRSSTSIGRKVSNWSVYLKRRICQCCEMEKNWSGIKIQIRISSKIWPIVSRFEAIAQTNFMNIYLQLFL